jgi:hypothetical protein
MSKTSFYHVRARPRRIRAARPNTVQTRCWTLPPLREPRQKTPPRRAQVLRRLARAARRRRR